MHTYSETHYQTNILQHVSSGNGVVYPLRKTCLSNILNTLPPKNEKFQMKNSDMFHISAQNIDCEYSLEPPRRGGSNEYHNLCFWAEIRKIMYTPVNPSFTIWKWGWRGSKLYRFVFVMYAKKWLWQNCNIHFQSLKYTIFVYIFSQIYSCTFNRHLESKFYFSGW